MDAALVSSGFFRVFQMRPQLGRTFSPEDDRPGSRSVVISYRAWVRHFNSDPHILGKPITLDGEPFTIIGMMPAGFRFPALGTDLWGTPAFDLRSRGRGSHYLFCVGRIRPGVTLGQAQAEMSTIAHRLERQYPDTNHGSGVVLVLASGRNGRRLSTGALPAMGRSDAGIVDRLRQRSPSAAGALCLAPERAGDQDRPRERDGCGWSGNC